MTGFGRFEIAEKERKVIVEMKSVNHRYCDINIKMPKALNYFEAQIRAVIKKYIQRGKIDVFITYEDSTQGRRSVKYNKSLAGDYMDAFRQMQQDFGLENDVSVISLSRCPEIIMLEEQSIDEDELWHFVGPAVEGACKSLAETRAREGSQLRKDLLEKLDLMLAHVSYIEERSPEIIEAYRKNLEDKIKELLTDKSIDENRIVMETAVYADKICIDEEIVRLKSHVKATRDALLTDDAVGRKLDFIAQEMNREANTILSKSSDLSTSDRAIDLKTEIEKVREQIQNIE